jgi:NAD(P)H-hydrate epimerase
MQLLPETLYNAAQARAFDRLAADGFGLSGEELMRRAGQAAFDLLRWRWPRARRIVVVSGPGNNGGDGYVLAQFAHAAGLAVRVYALGDPQKLHGAAHAARQHCVASGVGVTSLQTDALRDCDVLVDAVFGTGLERDLAGEWRAAVEAINAAGRPVLALDLPSGLHADTGRVLGVAVRASATLTFIALKAGLFTGAGRECSGEIFYDALGVPSALFTGTPPIARRITADALHDALPRRARHAHKGDAGHVLVVGGQPGMSGAARLAGEAAYRAGAGLVVLATHPQHAHCINIGRPELLSYGIADGAALRPLMAEADVIAVGPGLGQGEWGRALWGAVLDSATPLVVDADALNLLAADPVTRANWILTPHPGEAARLLQSTTADIQADRFQAARAIAARYGGVCVLKGSGSLIAQADDTLWLCDRGHPGMASGGMGDVVTGAIAGLLAQGATAPTAARAGVWAHAAAADAIAARRGELGLLASELVAELPVWVNRLIDR